MRLVLALFLASGLSAQIVSPHPHYANHEGDLYTPYLFTAPSRVQQIHEDLVGTPRLIQGLSFRRDGSLNGAPHPSVPAKTVTLTIDFAAAVPCVTATTTFASNATSTPTRVFGGTISTPASWQVPAASSPTDFDLRIPLSPWPYSGNGAFLWDAASTATSTTDRVLVDGASPSFFLFAWCGYQMHGSGCTTANGTFEVRGTGQTLGAPINGFTVKVTTAGGPSVAQSTWLIGFQALGANLPGLCAPIWPAPVASVTGATDAVGAWSPFFQLPMNPAWLGLGMEMQVAALDASQPAGLPLAASNGLTYRLAPMAPAFSVCSVQTSTAGSTTGSLLQRAAVVRFD